MESTGCPSLEHVRNVLFRCHLSVEAAVAQLHEELSEAYGSWSKVFEIAEQRRDTDRSEHCRNDLYGGNEFAYAVGFMSDDSAEDVELQTALALSAAEHQEQLSAANAPPPPPILYTEVYSKNVAFWFPAHLVHQVERVRPEGDLIWDTWSHDTPDSPPDSPIMGLDSSGSATNASSVPSSTVVASTTKSSQSVRQRSPSPPPIPRNRPCPCGSNKKYKNCCKKADDDRWARRSRQDTVAEIKTANLTNKQRKELARAQKLVPNTQPRSRNKGTDSAPAVKDFGSIGI